MGIAISHGGRLQGQCFPDRRAAAHINSQLYQHAQDLLKFKPDKILAWARGRWT